MDNKHGILVVSKKGKNRPPQIQITFENKTFNVAHGEISQSLLDRIEGRNGQDVEFEFVKGQPKKIREAGGTFIPPRAVTSDQRSQNRNMESHPMSRVRNTNACDQFQHTKRTFHNPYNFIPAPPRNVYDPDFGDHVPVRHDEIIVGNYTGRIRVSMSAVTPILLFDTENVRITNGHNTYPLRVDAEGKPSIPTSSIRGMLRSAYEAITNSRFGRFSSKQHQTHLAYRMDAKDGLYLIPARIKDEKIHLLTGTSNVSSDGRPQGPMYAAWLPRYNTKGGIAGDAVHYPDQSLPEHGDEVECIIRCNRHRSNRFEYWKVERIARKGELNCVTEPKDARRISGWVCVTNQNINRKHDERVFFQFPGVKPPGPFNLKQCHRKMWRELIRNYQELHKEDIKNRESAGKKPSDFLGKDVGETAWSRHIYTSCELELHDGTLCYVRLNDTHTDVAALFPVMISRALYPSSPWDLLHPSLRPATRLEELSPADRVFGWVSSDKDSDNNTSTSHRHAVAWRGQIRIGPVVCASKVNDAVERFPEGGLPLAILAAPKPQQGRFYVAKSKNGEAQDDGLNKADAGYSSQKGLRGRKVYPHHASLPDSHWKHPLEDRTQNSSGPWQEYRRPCKNGNEQRDNQNRSILGWVKPGAEFQFDIFLMNLSKVELGALLWLLQFPNHHYHRFGGGKPFGFGSVRLSIDTAELWCGESLIERYSSWCQNATPSNIVGDAIEEFQNALCRAYPQTGTGGFNDVSFVQAFSIACRGFNDRLLPVHYPRATNDGRHGPPNPDGELFKWFVGNERKGVRYSLRDLVNDPGLPTLITRD